MMATVSREEPTGASGLADSLRRAQLHGASLASFEYARVSLAGPYAGRPIYAGFLQYAGRRMVRLVLTGWIEKARLAGHDGGLGAIGDLELREDVLHVHLDGGRADDQLPGYLPVGLALGEEPQNLELAARQHVGERLGWFVRQGRVPHARPPSRARRLSRHMARSWLRGLPPSSAPRTARMSSCLPASFVM